MKLLFIHADYMEYEAREPTKFAESILDEVKKGRMEEVLVAFTAIEKQDEKNPLGSAEAASEEIADVVTFLASRRASFVSGANWLVDGCATPSLQI